MVSLVVQLVAAGLIILVLYLKNFKTLDSIAGIYRQNSKFYYLKVCAMYILLSIRKRKEGKPEDVDKPQPLSTNPLVSIHFL